MFCPFHSGFYSHLYQLIYRRVVTLEMKSTGRYSSIHIFLSKSVQHLIYVLGLMAISYDFLKSTPLPSEHLSSLAFTIFYFHTFRILNISISLAIYRFWFNFAVKYSHKIDFLTLSSSVDNSFIFKINLLMLRLCSLLSQYNLYHIIMYRTPFFAG